MLTRLALRLATEISPRLAAKAAYLWAWKGMKAIRAYRGRVRRGELFPPFLFLALTNACNLRCRGCWIPGASETHQLAPDEIDTVITAGKAQSTWFTTLLGGEPMMYPNVLDIPRRHPDCYFQIITNGLLLDDSSVERIRALGNVTPLISLDGQEATNDQRRGEGVFASAVEGMARLKRQKILFGVATTVTAANLDEVLSDEYVRQFVDRGAMYLWYYVFRPVGVDPAPELCVGRDQMLMVRRRLLELRRRHPIILIDTYWNASGEAVCPASLGLGFHIGPQGSIEPCPPLSFACQTIGEHDGDLFRTINESRLLRDFQSFVHNRTRGCVILEHPEALVEFLEEHSVTDYSGRDALAEIASSEPRSSHHLPGEEQAEDYWVYRFLKRQLFFGMGGYG